MSTAEPAPLFDPAPYAVEPPASLNRDLSADQRRTLRQREDIANGIHPLTRLKLHPDASPTTPVGGRGLRFTCDTCTHLVRLRYHDRRYLKCDTIAPTNGPGTDARGWWPACTSYIRNT